MNNSIHVLILSSIDRSTFDSSSDGHEAIFVYLGDVSSVQPSPIINGLLCLFLVVQVAHEHMATVQTQLQVNNAIEVFIIP